MPLVLGTNLGMGLHIAMHGEVPRADRVDLTSSTTAASARSGGRAHLRLRPDAGVPGRSVVGRYLRLLSRLPQLPRPRELVPGNRFQRDGVRSGPEHTASRRGVADQACKEAETPGGADDHAGDFDVVPRSQDQRLDVHR